MIRPARSWAEWLWVLVGAPVRGFRWMLFARPIRFTRLGWFYILFSLAVGAAAINTGNNLLYLILGILLGFIVVSGVLSDSGLWGLETVWSAEQALYAGDPVRLRVQALKRRFPSMVVSVIASFANAQPATSRLVFYWVSNKRPATAFLTVTPMRRGWLTLRTTRYLSQFPFGLFEKFHDLSRNERWLVYPVVRLLKNRDLGLIGDRGTERATAQKGSGSVPFQLRDYRLGDERRHIHWRTSARRQRLMVHDMQAENQQAPRLWVEQWPTVSSDAFESLISFLASLAYTFSVEKRPLALSTPDTEFAFDTTSSHLYRVYRYLALIDPSDSDRSRTRAKPKGSVVDVIALWKTLR